ncbi:hypothetical protein C1H46_008950 [Malus baccata]|uniref:Uncharacterized protein n=1 Tax=Malus baccata TaxID=106549 RepID=A0A540N309_MALBA|nr:hypothetical protein C1H46_008950 [Malus baccata]
MNKEILEKWPATTNPRLAGKMSTDNHTIRKRKDQVYASKWCQLHDKHLDISLATYNCKTGYKQL